ncbi:MAG: GyrI-like domain-containing protein [candidate division WOR-3 bacterium]|nr:MAG: GyrI-like domain-containing protein [candidate division WOR-3 bacterium]
MPTTLTDKKLGKLYFPSTKVPSVVRVPKMNFLMIDGKGDPRNAKSFQEAIGALYGTAYTMKFMYDKGHPIRNARVPPLEGLFWTQGRRLMSFDTHKGLCWTLMLRMPEPVGKRAVSAAIKALTEKKDPPGLDKLRFESLSEGLAVQIMHIGPYSAEPPTVERLFGFCRGNGYSPSGKHHEIYHSDPNRTKPEKLKTVIRYPVKRK